MSHPLYDDDTLVHHVSQHHIDAGRTIFQLWLSAPTEREHAINMLELVRPPHRARVLSLGCGVGGMEWYWHGARPDMRFTLQNISRAQLDLCLCPGERVLGDAQAFTLDGRSPYDVTVLAYVLGHCDVARTLEHAIKATEGTILVIDVMLDAEEAAFKRLLHYDPPSRWTLLRHGFRRLGDRGARWYRMPAGEDVGTTEQRAAVAASSPVLWVRHG